jgi:hypothetical protein
MQRRKRLELASFLLLCWSFAQSLDLNGVEKAKQLLANRSFYCFCYNGVGVKLCLEFFDFCRFLFGFYGRDEDLWIYGLVNGLGLLERLQVVASSRQQREPSKTSFNCFRTTHASDHENFLSRPLLMQIFALEMIFHREWIVNFLPHHDPINCFLPVKGSREHQNAIMPRAPILSIIVEALIGSETNF